MSQNPSEIDVALECIRAGDKKKAQQILIPIVKKEPDNARAWFVLSQVVETTERERYCLEEVLRVNPESQQAKRRLQEIVPSQLDMKVRPTTTYTSESSKQRLWLRWVVLGVTIFILVIFVSGIIYIDNARKEVEQQIVEAILTTPNAPLPSKTVPAVEDSLVGLGSTKDYWNVVHRFHDDQQGFVSYDQGKYVVSFSSDKRIWYLEIVWGDENAVTLDYAMKDARTFIPEDSQYLDTYEPREYRIVEHFSSTQLSSLFDEISWLGSPAGEFIVIYRIYNKKVTSYLISLGNNP